MDNKKLPQESDLERLARTIKPEQIRALIGAFYGKDDAVLLLDANYNFTLATRTAELKLGYCSDTILLDSLKLKTEVFRRLNELCHEKFEGERANSFELKGIAYSSSDEKTSFLLNIRVDRIQYGGAVVSLQKVARQPYQKKEEDLIVAAPNFIDDHWNRKDMWHGETFEEKLNAAYISAAHGRRVVIDLTRTRDIGFAQTQDIIKATKDKTGIIFLNAKPGVYESLHDNGRGIPAERLVYNADLVPAPKPA